MHAPAVAVAAALCALLTGCGSQGLPTSATDPSPGAQGRAGAVPDVPPAYRFVLTSSCGERGLLGDYGVTVRDDRVTVVENLNKGYPYEPRLAEVPTLTDLALMGESEPEGGVVDYVVDDDGLPRSLTLDPLPDAVDDEECYVVSDVQPLGDRPEPQPQGQHSPTAGRRGPLPDGGAASCVEEYTPGAIAGRAFAFDGIVTAIGSSVSDRGDEADLDLPGVTFEVLESFSGSQGDTVTVDLQPPTWPADPSDPLYAYGVGSRLLVSGEARWGGSPLQRPIAWGCGFTRYFDRDTADRWRNAAAG